MDTYTPEELWSLWKREEPPPETVVGHIIQNLIRLQRAHDTHTQAHHALKRKNDQRQNDGEGLKSEGSKGGGLKDQVSRLQTDLKDPIPLNQALHLWSRGALSTEEAMTQILSNLIKLQRALDALNITVYNLRADVDSLIAHTRMPLEPKSSPKTSQED